MDYFVARFQRIMHHLAFSAMVLMLCMPVISRWQQTHTRAPSSDAGMCLSETSRAVLDAHAHHRAQNNPTSPDYPHDHHHHDACGYCTLATRMLPVLALLLALPRPIRTRHRAPLHHPAPPPAPVWRAHPPRGPPVLL